MPDIKSRAGGGRTFDYETPLNESVECVVQAFTKAIQVSDSEQKMSFNLTWSRRWRRRGAAAPRCGRTRVYASRVGVTAVSRRRRSHTGVPQHQTGPKLRHGALILAEARPY